MSANASPLVSRLADYEPPAFGGPPELPPLTSARPHRATPSSTSPARPVEDPASRATAAFADAVLRRVLEVIDRRRPMSQLRPLLAAGLADSLLAAAGRGPAGTPARLRRVLARPVGDHAAEVAACYSRGDRVHAVACRIEQISTPTGPRWQVVALHMG